MMLIPGGRAGRALTKNFKYVIRKLNIDPKIAHAAIHRAKRGRGGADNVLFDPDNGDIISPETGEVLGNLSDPY